MKTEEKDSIHRRLPKKKRYILVGPKFQIVMFEKNA
jgi:hypothetical protein